mgnify:CR=1 FL=1
MAAEEMELVTDRPEQIKSSVAIPPGYFQIEAGWTATNDNESVTETEFYEVRGTLASIDLTDRVELQLGGAGYISEKSKPLASRRHQKSLIQEVCHE